MVGRVLTVQKAGAKTREQYGGKWIVKLSGRLSSTHGTKKEAVGQARARANVGDTIHIKNSRGTITDRFTKQEHTPNTGFFSDLESDLY